MTWAVRLSARLVPQLVPLAWCGRLAWLAQLAALTLIALGSSGCLFARIMYYNTPSLDAPAMFDNREVRPSPQPVPLERAAREARPALSEAERSKYATFDQLLVDSDTRSFLILKDDRIVYERYFSDVTAATQLPSFSMSKTYAAVLVGRALRDGVFGSMDDKLVSYVPELAKKPGYGAITLEQLLRMTSGIDFDEESVAGAKLYYTTDLRDLLYSYDVTRQPGTSYLYGSVNVQLLWDALQHRLGTTSVTRYFERAVWGPLGATQPASWSLDSREHGVEKLFGGFNATTRDHARLGLLFLHGGTLNGEELLPRAWVERSISIDPIAGVRTTSDGHVLRGEYQWFVTLDRRGYFAKGYHGQYVFVVPSAHAVFVRFGEGYGDVSWTSLFLRLASQL